jgi:hypothetical protein
LNAQLDVVGASADVDLPSGGHLLDNFPVILGSQALLSMLSSENPIPPTQIDQQPVTQIALVESEPEKQTDALSLMRAASC